MSVLLVDKDLRHSAAVAAYASSILALFVSVQNACKVVQVNGLVMVIRFLVSTLGSSKKVPQSLFC